MKLSFVVFGLVAVLVNSGDARATLSRDELLDKLTEELLVRYFDRRNPDESLKSINSRGVYNNAPVRRWWGNKPSSGTSSSLSASNSGDISNNYINGGLSAGVFGNQGRK